MRVSEPLQQVRRTYVRHEGQTLSYFSGCDYFRLSSHPRIVRAVKDGLSRYGLNVAASRITTGNHELYVRLEKQLAGFFRSESALLTSTGYMTNLVVAQALAGQFSHALMDERAHVALKDAAQFLNCPVLSFKHRDVASFGIALVRCGIGARPLVLTDGMFSHDGSVAPLSKGVVKGSLLTFDTSSVMDATATAMLRVDGSRLMVGRKDERGKSSFARQIVPTRTARFSHQIDAVFASR